MSGICQNTGIPLFPPSYPEAAVSTVVMHNAVIFQSCPVHLCGMLKMLDEPNVISVT